MPENNNHMKPALLVIDIQNAYLSMMDERNKEKGMYMINGFISAFRKKGFPVIHIYHEDIVSGYGPKKGTDAFEFPATVSMQPEDAKVIKHYGDGFNKTDLDPILKEKGINTVFMCGLSAVGCVLHTWVGAQNHDYKAFLLKDAIISHDGEYTKAIETIFDAIGWDTVQTMLDFC